MKKALLYLFAFLAIQYTVQLLVTMVYMLVATTGKNVNMQQAANELPTSWYIGVMVAFSVVTIVVFLKTGWATASREYMRTRPWGVLAWSVVAALGAIVPSLILQGMLPEWTGWAEEVARKTEEQMGKLMKEPGGYMVIALLPPVVEELVFRGAILKSLLEWKPSRPWVMIVLSAIIFSLVHMNPAQMPHTFLIGLLLGWMYMRTGSIVPGVAYHWANNTAAYVMFHVYQNPQELSDIIGPGRRPLLMALAFSLCILLPALMQLHLRMKRT